MGNVIDFNKAKEQKQEANQLEENYLRVLSGLNQMIGIPKDVVSCSQVFYYIMRYFEGTVNCLGILSILPSCDRKLLDELKFHLLNWIDNLREEIEAI